VSKEKKGWFALLSANLLLSMAKLEVNEWCVDDSMAENRCVGSFGSSVVNEGNRALDQTALVIQLRIQARAQSVWCADRRVQAE
jgi:hypothetical protein